MRWSLKIAEVAGIGVFVHWTFLLLLGWIAVAHYNPSLPPREAAWEVVQGVAFILALFACVILHELGHALTALYFGVRTRDITLLPIGGVARLERMPEGPLQEFWVALAGPAVNVAIGAVLLAALLALGEAPLLLDIKMVGGSFLAKLLIVNVALVIFNMMPAFPMDGGRVLRSLLALWMPRARATHIAASIGQGLAILFGLAGVITGQWLWVFIALFVYLGAQSEAQAAEMQAIFRTVPVRDAMATQFRTLSPADPLDFAARLLLAGHQQDFPVVEGERVVGLLRRSDLLRGLSEEAPRPSPTVADVMVGDCPVAEANEPLDEAVARMREAECSAAPVVAAGRLVGLLTSENIGEWAMIQAALRKRAGRRL